MLATNRQDRIRKLFGKVLKRAREQKYRSAEQFAHKLGIEPHTYRKYERGETEPNFETLTRICEDLEITPNDLLPAAAESPFRSAVSKAS
jgi:transcriptional regulator with XRE-family HTH domain